jgi:hypothetical protein
MLRTLTLISFFISNFWIAPQASANGIFYNENGLRIELSEKVEEAIDAGIALTFESEFAHIETFLFVSWAEQIKQHRFTVSRHALSNRYLVHHKQSLAPSMFRSKRESMSYIAEQTMTLFMKYHDQDIHNTERHEMRLRLSIAELPGPLRLSAFINKEWDLDSGWNIWQSAQ